MVAIFCLLLSISEAIRVLLLVHLADLGHFRLDVAHIQLTFSFVSCAEILQKIAILKFTWHSQHIQFR